MLILKCKSCGGNLNVQPEQIICKCEYCGSMQTVPRVGDDQEAKHSLGGNEFNKTAGAPSELLAENGRKVASTESKWPKRGRKVAKRRAFIIAVVAIAVIGSICIWNYVISPAQRYKDVDSLIKDANLSAIAWRPFTQVGNIVKYGHYEQDNDETNGPEPIDWIVLSYDETKGESLLISKYGLDAKKYEGAFYYPTWAKSELRTWLNNDFMNAAFTDEEQKGIVATRINTPSYNGKNGGADTEDRIWLLSRDEAQKYFSSNDDRRTKATAYANAQGAYIGNYGYCWWWLRSPGNLDISAADISDDGSFSGNCVGYAYDVARPVLVLSLASADIY